MSFYRHVSLEDRIRIKTYLEQGLNQSTIAVKLVFHKSTISREIRRNSGQKGYRYKQAQALSEERQLCRQAPTKMRPVWYLESGNYSRYSGPLGCSLGLMWWRITFKPYKIDLIPT